MTKNSNQTLSIALLGFGVVGSAVYDSLQREANEFERRLGVKLQIQKIAVRDLQKKRSVDAKLLTIDWRAVATSPDADIVIELMGDVPEAREAILLALAAGKSVVTANKAILSRHATEIFTAAQKHHAGILFEAAVAGAVPILRVLRDGLCADQLKDLRGIINGTCNYILTRMSHEGADFQAVLSDAQKLGFAETDPSADIDGHDAVAKLSLLILLAYGVVLNPQDIFCRGISYLRPLDLEMAKQFGYAVKFLGIAKRHNGQIEARVHPTMISKSSPLAHVSGPSNAIEYFGEKAGEGMMLGVGAGGAATASAVLADVFAFARAKVTNAQLPSVLGFPADTIVSAKPCDILTLESRYYIRFSVHDRPNVLAKLTGILSRHGISIKHLYQHGEHEDKVIPVIVFTHKALEQNIRTALKEADAEDFVTETTKIIRIEDDGE